MRTEPCLEADYMQSDDYEQADSVELYEDNAFHYSRLAEWYITACMTYLLIEAFFHKFIEHALKSQTYWFLNLTPWKTLPSVLWFFSFGLLFGIFIFLSKKEGLVPIRGKALFFSLWLVILFATFHGKIAGYPTWLATFRQTILPSVIVFWVAPLAQSIRYKVILSRFITISLPLAVINLFYGINFFAGGAIISKDSLFTASWIGTYILILAYLAAFARIIAGQKKRLDCYGNTFLWYPGSSPETCNSYIRFCKLSVIISCLQGATVRGRYSYWEDFYLDHYYPDRWNDRWFNNFRFWK